MGISLLDISLLAKLQKMDLASRWFITVYMEQRKRTEAIVGKLMGCKNSFV